MPILVPVHEANDCHLPASRRAVREFNSCHLPAGSPQGGQFCSTKTMQVTRVGITSARPPGPEFHPSREVFGHMRQFEQELRRLPGVSKVSVKPGLGAWQGGSEPTWIVGYRGNGQAQALLARTAKVFNQDAVLLMRGCKGDGCDPAVELHFDRPVGKAAMDAIGDVMGGEGLGGWTWGKRGGRTVLRSVSIPAWGGERSAHLATMRRVSAALASRGWTHRSRVKMVKTEVMERGQYDAYIE